MTAADIFFDTGLRVEQQLQMLKPFLQLWIGDNYLTYYNAAIDYFSYRPFDKLMFAIGRNNRYQQTDDDENMFRYKITYVDMEEKYSNEEKLEHVNTLLKILWANNIPTCVPSLADELPFNGGEDGPIEWPE